MIEDREAFINAIKKHNEVKEEIDKIRDEFMESEEYRVLKTVSKQNINRILSDYWQWKEPWWTAFDDVDLKYSEEDDDIWA